MESWLVARTLGRVFRRALESFPVVLVTGPRQSGKTTFVRAELPDSPYMNLDDPLERERVVADPRSVLLQDTQSPLILDEAQRTPEILSYVKLLVDNRRHVPGQFVLTGSQHFGLMASVAESLAGRVALLELLPFDLMEASTLAKKPALEAVLWKGLFPDPCLGRVARDLWLASYVRTYLERDVRQVLQVRDLAAFQTFLARLCALHGQELNYSSLARDVGVSVPTIKSWVGVLQASYVLILVRPYHANLRKKLVKTPKAYIIDPGLVSYVTRQPSPRAALAGPMAGPLFEGLVVSEVFKFFAHRGKPADVYYLRTRDGLEIDLLIQVGDRLYPVEVKLTSTPRAAHVAPFERLARVANKDLSLQKGVLVCTVDSETPLPHGHLALPWHTVPAWLSAIT